MNHTDYLDSIRMNHSVVSFSPSKSVFYISLWNGVLRDGLIEDIDISFFEAKHPFIRDSSLHFDNKNIFLSTQQLSHLRTIFPELN
jgi:hypothetical protein